MSYPTISNFIKFIGLVILGFTIGCSHKTSENKLTIATAANVQYAMQDLILAFTAKTGILCQTITGSSGNLTAQIKNGAPYDLFFSANMKYPEDLYKNGYTQEPPRVYAYGKLVLWTLKDIQLNEKTLTNQKIQKISLANPKNAPYGDAAQVYLQRINLESSLKDKLVYGESISQVNQFIFSKSVDVGFTAKSVVLAPEMKGKGTWIELNQENYPKIAQGMVVIKNTSSTKKEMTKKFKEFLLSSAAKKILAAYGYQTDLSL